MRVGINYLKDLVEEAIDRRDVVASEAVIERIADRILYRVNDAGEIKLSTLHTIIFTAYDEIEAEYD